MADDLFIKVDDTWADTADDRWYPPATVTPNDVVAATYVTTNGIIVKDVEPSAVIVASTVTSVTGMTIRQYVDPNDVVVASTVTSVTGITIRQYVDPNDVTSAGSAVGSPSAQRVVTVTPSDVVSATTVSNVAGMTFRRAVAPSNVVSASVAPTISFTRRRLIDAADITSTPSVTGTVQAVKYFKPNNVSAATSIGAPAVTIGIYGDQFADTADDEWESTADDYWYPDTGAVDVTVNNVTSATSVGTTAIDSRTRLITPTDVTSASSVASPTVISVGRVDVDPANVVSATAVGSPTATALGEVYFIDDATFEFVDDDEFKWSPFAAANIQPNDVSAATSVSTATIPARTRLITPTNVVSTPSVGSPAISRYAAVTVTPTAVASATAVGSPTAQRVVTVTPTAITSATSVSTPVARKVALVSPSDVTSATNIFTWFAFQAVRNVTISNVTAGTSVDEPSVGRIRLITPNAVSATPDITNPTIGTYSIVTVTPNDVTSATRVRNVRVYIYGVAQRRGELLLLKAA